MKTPNIKKGLVSILTPSYNASKYISNLLDSIINQDYPSIEMIIVDDGSTDNTSQIISSYISIFKERNYSLKLLKQPNAGQSTAIKNGLKYISGEFLVWPDSDDYFTSHNAITSMVDIFNNEGKNIGIVRTREALIEKSSCNIDTIIGVNGERIKGIQKTPSIFKDCLLQENGFYFTPGGYMLRTEYLYNTSKDFYVNKMAGQNVQLLLPVLYHYDCYTIPQIHINIVVHTDSHSRKIAHSYDKTIALYNVYEETVKQTLRNIIGITQTDLSIYERLNKIRYDSCRLELSYMFNKPTQGKYYYSQLKSKNAKIPLKLRIKYFLLRGKELFKLH